MTGDDPVDAAPYADRVSSARQRPAPEGGAGLPSGRLDLACFSYLAETTILTVEQYPTANRGAIVRDAIESIAADGPIVTLAVARLGLRTALVANPVGTDPAGRQLIDTLNDHRVRHATRFRAGARTPHLTVIADDADTRTWFAQLDSVAADLMAADVELLSQAQLAYIDCYAALARPAARAITASVRTPLLLNLGGDEPPPDVIEAAAGRHVALVQTNLDESRAEEAGALARDLRERFGADAAVITLGGRGAYVHAPQHGSRHLPAPTIRPERVRNTHGAGAAFSAGYAHALLTGSDPVAATRAGCDLGTAHCTTRSVPATHPTRPTNREPEPASDTFQAGPAAGPALGSALGPARHPVIREGASR